MLCLYNSVSYTTTNVLLILLIQDDEDDDDRLPHYHVYNVISIYFVSEDDTAELLRELQKIKKERAEEQARKVLR